MSVFYPCTGSFSVLFTPEDNLTGESLGEALTEACGSNWVQMYFPSVAQSSVRAAATSALPASGQGSQQVVLADFNGDGNPDVAMITSIGVRVKLLASDGSVLTSTNYSVASSTNIITADFNGDGKLDLAVTSFGSASATPSVVAILLGNGDGTFTAAASANAGLNPATLAAADFNGDGKLDLAVGNYSSGNASGLGPGTVSILAGNGDGTFAAPVTYTIGEDSTGFPSSLLALDLNGDGRPDLAVANRNDNSISVLLNAGGGTFQKPSVTSLPYSVEYLAYSDFNHDGNPDLVASSFHSNGLLMLLGKGDGTFQPAVPYVTGNNPTSVGVMPLADGNSLIVTVDQITGSEWFAVANPQGAVGAPALNSVGGTPTAIAAGDLNGDGQPDAVVVGAASDVDVLVSKNGQFATPVGYSLGSPQPMAVAIADLSNDGKADVVTANAAGSVSVLLGNGDGTLGLPVSTSVDQNAMSLAIADFNGDGNLDVAVASYGAVLGSDTGSIAVLPGNGRGALGGGITLTVPGLHPAAIAAADLNGDAIPDLAVLAEEGDGTSPATLAIFLGQRGGTFEAPTTFPLQAIGGPKSGIAIGDVNGDGIPDIVDYSNNGTKIDVLLGNGSGGFHESATLTTLAASGGEVGLADVNRDGKLDLVTTGSFFPGNGDGTFQAEQQFLSGFSSNGVAVTKLNGAPFLISADQGGTVVGTELELPIVSHLQRPHLPSRK
jgi:FG-GAP-like repeat